VEWLRNNGLVDVGNDPKRHSDATHQRFMLAQRGGGAAAPEPPKNEQITTTCTADKGAPYPTCHALPMTAGYGCDDPDFSEPQPE
jgi:hypothetical protein